MLKGTTMATLFIFTVLAFKTISNQKFYYKSQGFQEFLLDYGAKAVYQ